MVPVPRYLLYFTVFTLLLFTAVKHSTLSEEPIRRQVVRTPRGDQGMSENSVAWGRVDESSATIALCITVPLSVVSSAFILAMLWWYNPKRTALPPRRLLAVPDVWAGEERGIAL